MLRRLDFKKYNLYYNPKYKCEDYELWSRAVRILDFYNLQEVLLKYRVHSSNASKPNPDFDADDAKVRQNMLDYLSGNSLLGKLKIIKRKIKNRIKKELYG